MKLFDIVWKEISLVKSQKVALLLIFIYPFIAIALLGTSFAGINAPDKVTVGLVNELSADSNMLSQVSSLKELSIITFSDTNQMVSAVKKKEVMVGMKLSSESAYSKVKVDLYYDNSNLLASQFFLQIAQAMVRNITTTASQQKLSSIWLTISNLSSNISSELENVRDFQAKLDASEVSLGKLETDLNALDFSEIEGTLDEQGTAISDLKSDSNQFRKDFAEFKSSFNSMEAEVLALKPAISSYKASLQAASSQLNDSAASLDEIISSLEAVRDSSPEAIDSALAQLRTTRQTLADYQSNINQALASIAQAEADFAKIEESMKKADVIFARVDSTMSKVDSQLTSSSTAIGNVHSKLALFKESVDEVKGLISEAKKSKQEISTKLASSEGMLSSFSSQLGDFRKMDPSTLAQPAIFFENRIYDVDPFGILASNVIAIVLVMTCMLLTSILIILERTQNVSMRFRLSSTSKAYLLLGKIIGQLVLAWIETAIILVVAFAKIPLPFEIFGVSHIGFGLVSNVSLPELFAAVTLVSLAFISFGMLIAFFAKTQSTAILASLLVIVPMLFLSGAILPLEFMKPFMQSISRVMPLTAANNLLVSVIVKGAHLSDSVIEILVLLLLVIVVLFLVALKKEY
ncbi:MAG: ABC transporter permease [archaeon]